MKLKPKDRAKLWGEDGPYSEADLVMENRILDDKLTRIFIIVEMRINPFTFEMIKKHKSIFKDDPLVQELIDQAEYMGQSYGYEFVAYRSLYRGEEIMREAEKSLEECKKMIIKIHKFVIDLIEEKSVN